MGERTGIAWTDHTFNPWIGCTRVSPGCDACYAAHSTPARAMGIQWGPGLPRRRTSFSNWQKPLAWNRGAKASGKRRLVFCASLSDVFDNEAPEGAREDLWDLIRATPFLTWQLVTKRIGNAPRMLPADWGRGWANVWLLSTIVNQEEADRDIPKLLEVPAVVHGISYEPALDPVDWKPWLWEISKATCRREPRRALGLPGLDWIIVGGESDQPGSKARQFPVSWARSTIEQCRAAGVPVFVKQLGANPLIAACDAFDPCTFVRRTTVHKWDDPAAWPEWLRVREFPA